jgi:hypothetical protein
LSIVDQAVSSVNRLLQIEARKRPVGAAREIGLTTTDQAGGDIVGIANASCGAWSFPTWSKQKTAARTGVGSRVENSCSMRESCNGSATNFRIDCWSEGRLSFREQVIATSIRCQLSVHILLAESSAGGTMRTAISTPSIVVLRAAQASSMTSNISRSP